MLPTHPPNSAAHPRAQAGGPSLHSVSRSDDVFQHVVETRSLGLRGSIPDVFLAMVIYELSKSKDRTGQARLSTIVVPITIGVTTKGDFINIACNAGMNVATHSLSILWHLFPQGSGLGGVGNDSLGFTPIQWMNDDTFWSCVKKMQAREHHGFGQDYFTCDVLDEPRFEHNKKSTITVRNTNGDVIDLSGLKDTTPKGSVTVRNPNGNVVDLARFKDASTSVNTARTKPQTTAMANGHVETRKVSQGLPSPTPVDAKTTISASTQTQKRRCSSTRRSDVFDDKVQSSSTSYKSSSSDYDEDDDDNEIDTPRPARMVASKNDSPVQWPFHERGEIPTGFTRAETADARLEAQLELQRASLQWTIEDRYRRGIPVLRPGPIVRRPQFCMAPPEARVQPMSATFHHVDDDDEQDEEEDIFAPRNNARFRTAIGSSKRRSSRDGKTAHIDTGGSVKMNETGGARLR